MSIRDDLMRDEGLRLRPYKDSLGVESIGYGRNLEVGISQAEASLMLDNDIARAEADLDHAFPWWRGRPDWVQRGMTNACFQLGLEGLATFRTGLACLQAGDYAGARTAFTDSLWAKQTPARAARVIALFSDKEPIDGTGT